MPSLKSPSLPLAQEPHAPVYAPLVILYWHITLTPTEPVALALFTVHPEILRWRVGAPHSWCYGGAVNICSLSRSCIASFAMVQLVPVKKTVRPIYGGAQAVCKRIKGMLRSLPHYVVHNPSKILNPAPFGRKRLPKCLSFRLFSGLLLPPFGRFTPACA